MAKSVDPECPAFEAAIAVLGRPWTGLILRLLLQGGALRFSELAERARGTGDKILSARLKELESRGIIVRRVEHGPPVRVLYQLTPKGEAFEKVAESIELWGRALIDQGEAKRRRPA
jgi:DNA-binding HxlR family transcriptional regulator